MTFEESLEYEQRLHRRYFEPFDRLLEKKAQYYLDKTAETGQQYQMLLEEIEVLERFREYVVMLESIAQQQLDITYKAASVAEFWREEWQKELIHSAQQNEVLALCIQQLDKVKSLQ